MKNVLILIVLMGLFSCKVSSPQATINEVNKAEESLIAGSYIVELREDIFVPILSEEQYINAEEKDEEMLYALEIKKKEKIRNFASEYGIEIKPGDFLLYASSGFYAENLTAETVGRLARDTANVLSIQQDFTLQDIRARMQETGPFPEDIRARMQASWGYDTIGFTSKAVKYVGGGANPVSTLRKIWIIDSGIDASHQDLKTQFASGLDSSWVSSSVEERNPKIDFIGHGTHCAGLAAGKAFNQNQPNNQNLIGMNGVSPGAQLVSLKVFANDRTAKWNWIKKSLDYVAKYSGKKDVVSLSLGDFVSNCNSHGIRPVLEKLKGKGVFVVMAAGNGNGGIGQDGGDFLPGCIFGIDGVFTIGSMRIDFDFPTIPNSFSIFSNFGANVAFVAPGEMIFSTFPNDTYSVASGTSAATAIVAGIIHANGGIPGQMTEKVLGPPGTTSYPIPKRNP